MDWIQSLTRAIRYMEAHLTEEIDIESVANHIYVSASHFQMVFHVVTGLTAGEYIRNRRLHLAAGDLIQSNHKIIDVAMRYQYDTGESFSKAFTRFHGVPPSKARQNNTKTFYPMSIHITVEGGFDMSRTIIDDFILLGGHTREQPQNPEPNAEAYKILTKQALEARKRNPSVFDALTQWMLDDSKWGDEQVKENEWIFTQGVLARFREQNAKLTALLHQLQPFGVVNQAVFPALERFDRVLSGEDVDVLIGQTLAKVLADFSVMKDAKIRKIIAGGKTGAAGVETVDFFGYLNILKDCDAGVQWALFMPDMVKEQQKGFQVDDFEVKQMSALRFIGFEGDEYDNEAKRREKMCVLDGMTEYKSDFDYDILFMHHYGLGVDVGPWHGVWGRFFRADTPVPQGFIHFDLLPNPPAKPGPPYRSRFAIATFSGDMEAMHAREGFDSDAMYDVTRNLLLGAGTGIPYPDKYWTAEVFFDGCDQWSTGYLFAAC